MIPSPGDGWSRLSPRKLLLDPVKAVGQAVVPVVVALVGISQSDGRFGWVLLPIAVIAPLLFGALPWLTTHYRLTDTQVQVRRGGHSSGGHLASSFHGRSLSTRCSPGSPRTRSATMLRMISEVPPSIELPLARR